MRKQLQPIADYPVMSLRSFGRTPFIYSYAQCHKTCSFSYHKKTFMTVIKHFYPNIALKPFTIPTISFMIEEEYTADLQRSKYAPGEDREKRKLGCYRLDMQRREDR
ncbi:hypothetical protein M3650_04455 [Paenibacillus sp. MER TA 81-3]|uniref:hypothetical protein n=1 Tax=Paenibacillus sp. MER TA 81-3 TaxID=2939573 RepID=UPI00203FF278|nr:hypothetical protein [Paenibacillus sp. MER TA 81-3]MCM3337903.1 hypothetical protein [Paenibacillus sp. MER TA 81-3]